MEWKLWILRECCAIDAYLTLCMHTVAQVKATSARQVALPEDILVTMICWIQLAANRSCSASLACSRCIRPRQISLGQAVLDRGESSA